MGRKNKTAIVSTFARGPYKAAERELWLELDRVLRLANLQRGNPFWREALISIAEQRRPRWDAERLNIDGVDDDLNEVFFGPLFRNLQSMVRAGVVYLRACPHCDKWFLADHATRRVCTDRRCQNVLGAARQKKARAGEQAEQRKARVTIKSTRR